MPTAQEEVHRPRHVAGKPLAAAERQVEHLVLLDAERPELRNRRREQLDRAELQRFDLLAVLVQRRVRVHLDLDAALGALLGQPLLALAKVVDLGLQAQREAAWGEVARRLAHEIKNPLTPIQLSAERIRRRYLGSLGGEDSDLLDRATHTIVQQVEAMKQMVDDFAIYARTPRPGQLQRIDVKSLLLDVLALYDNLRPHTSLALPDAAVVIQGEPTRLRQDDD